MKRIDPTVHRERFWSKVADDKGRWSCWEWTGARDNKGYGAFYPRHGEPMERAHRVAYYLWYGEDPGAMCVCHECDNPPCVNPHHLFLGTRSDNNKDRSAKGRNYTAYGESHGMSKLTWEDVLAIRASPLDSIQLARRYPVSSSAIRRARTGATWKFPTNAHARALTSSNYEE